MRISLILGHPNPGSFNHAIAAAAREQLLDGGHQVDFHDLYAEGFNPCLTPPELVPGSPIPELLSGYCAEAARADGLIVVHPNWWGQPPAMLKGWVDRVLRAGVAYKFGVNDKGEGVPIGLLRAKAALVFNTANTPVEREQAIFGDPLEGLWKRCIFDFCGVKVVDRRVFSVVVTSTPGERERWLAEVRSMVAVRFSQA